MQNEEIVTGTWREVGYRARPLRDTVFVRTELRPEKDGSIYIPPAYRGSYSGFANTVLLRAFVVAVGPQCKVVKVGDHVCFTRLFFARYCEMQDGTLLGYLREDQLSGFIED